MDILWNLKLNGIYAPDSNSMYRRVPGGWVYSDMNGCCFVPLNNEFQLANTTDCNESCEYSHSRRREFGYNFCERCGCDLRIQDDACYPCGISGFQPCPNKDCDNDLCNKFSTP